MAIRPVLYRLGSNRDEATLVKRQILVSMKGITHHTTFGNLRTCLSLYACDPTFIYIYTYAPT